PCWPKAWKPPPSATSSAPPAASSCRATSSAAPCPPMRSRRSGCSHRPASATPTPPPAAPPRADRAKSRSSASRRRVRAADAPRRASEHRRRPRLRWQRANMAQSANRGAPSSSPRTDPPTRPKADPRRMKIASWNVNSLNVRLPHLERWLREAEPDVVGLQETKLEDDRFPDAVLAGLGYRSVFHGQKTYNGVAVLARERAIDDVQMGIPGFEDDQKRVIAATVGDVRIVNLYVVNGQDVGTDKYAYKLRWLEAVHGWLAQELQRHPRLVVLGDFNIAPDDRDVHDPALWNDQHILTSAAERAALQRLLALGLHDGFRLHHD